MLGVLTDKFYLLSKPVIPIGAGIYILSFRI